MYEDYKAKRPPKPVEIVAVIPMVTLHHFSSSIRNSLYDNECAEARDC